jgi:hypothetical protein
VPRVDLSGVRIDEIILNGEGVLGVDEVERDIISDLEVTIQSKEPLEDVSGERMGVSPSSSRVGMVPGVLGFGYTCHHTLPEVGMRVDEGKGGKCRFERCW